MKPHAILPKHILFPNRRERILEVLNIGLHCLLRPRKDNDIKTGRGIKEPVLLHKSDGQTRQASLLGLINGL